MNGRLHIIAAGMVTAVGLDAPSSCAALRARIDGFREVPFADQDGEWLLGAPVPLPRPWIGDKRLVHMLAAAIGEIYEAFPAARSNAPIFLCLPEDTRPDAPTSDSGRFLKKLASVLEVDIDANSRLIAHGRPSGLVGLDYAQRFLRGGHGQSVIIAGVDSFLTPGAVSHFLSNRRLLATNNPNGFIPGEAAGAILCEKGGRGLQLFGLGLAREKASIYNASGLPLRGDGMASAYDQAMRQAGIEMNQLGFRISDLIGEQYWFKQTALASLRLVRGAHDFQDIWSPGESLGNIGAAVVPVMIGMALTAARKAYAAGDPVLIEASDDSGACAAAVLSTGGRP